VRALIATSAFIAPVLLAVAIGSSFAGGVEIRPQLNGAAMNELRAYAAKRDNLLERYACDPGEAVVNMPHLVLERFDRRGCDRGGQPWYRLANQPAPCGLLRRTAAGTAAAASTVDGTVPTLVLPLTQRWSYWELVPSKPPTSP